MPYLWEHSTDLELNIGNSNYHIYNYNTQNPKFLISNRMLVNSMFSQGNDQKNIQIETRFAHQFKPNIHVYLDYNRIANAGIYTRQKGKHTNLVAGFWIDRSKWDSFIIYTSNVNEEENNGGVSDLTLFNDQFHAVRTNIPVFLEEAKTRIQQKSILVKNYYQPVFENSKLKFFHQIEYNTKWFKYTDESPNADFYGIYHLDDRATRHFIRDKILENRIGVELAGNTFIDSTYSFADKNNAYLSFDVSLQKHWINHEPDLYQAHDLFLSSIYSKKISSGLKLQLKGKYGLLDANNTYLLQAAINKEWSKWLNLDYRFNWSNRRPNLIENQFNLLGHIQWDQEFKLKNSLTNELTIDVPKIGLDIKLAHHSIKNMIYFDSLIRPIQLDQLVQISQAQLKHHISFWKFGLDSYLTFQHFNHSSIQLPSLILKESIYFEGDLFNNSMRLKTGLDFKFTDQYEVYAFQPLIGQFYQDAEMKGGLYPELDAFLSFKVASFIAFVRAQNIYSLISDDINYHVSRHPVFDFNLRFGLRWTFLD